MCALCDYVHVSSKKVKKLVRIHILQLCHVIDLLSFMHLAIDFYI